MNILIPHKWLLEHLDTEAGPKEIQEKLSLSGPSVERIYDKAGESVYDIEVTTNRVDSMSIRGIARESAVILEEFGIPAKLKPLPVADTQLEPDLPEDQLLPMPEIKGDPKLCNRITAIILQGVERTPTPDWMAQKLTQIDINIHDSVIDITNYITHELGHPIHAFDYDKLMALGGQIIVKEAETGKEFTTLDGVTYKTVGGEVVFENNQGEIIDLPSIKGTLNSSIDDSTKNVLLLVDSIMPAKIRFASMTHQIRTVAAQLNEKSVDPHLGLPTMTFGVKLYRELCNAKVASHLFDDFPGSFSLETVNLPLKTVHEYLGLELPVEKIIKILTSLECQVENNGDSLAVTPPTFRSDLTIPADLIEEIARIYGYHNLPSKLMQGEIPTNKPLNTDFVIENRIQRYLSAIGWQEVYSFSLVSSDVALKSGYSLEEHLALQNPLTEDHVYLRRNLLASLEQVLDENADRQNFSIFELANTYQPRSGDLPNEEMTLGMTSNKPYRQIRGDLEALLRQFFIKNIKIEPDNTQDVIQQGKIIAITEGDSPEVELGILQINHKHQVGCQISLPTLVKIAKTHPQYQPIPAFAPLMEDLTLTLEEKTPIGLVMDAIHDQDELVQRVSLTSEYERNFTFRITFQSRERNLSNEEVRPIREKIVRTVAEKFGAKLVGNLN